MVSFIYTRRKTAVASKVTDSAGEKFLFVIAALGKLALIKLCPIHRCVVFFSFFLFWVFFCRRVCEFWSFMFGSVHSADGSLRRVSGSGFCSTSGPALSSESGLSLICYKLALSQIHTHTHTQHSLTHTSVGQCLDVVGRRCV